MIEIIFEAHATSKDNEAKLASGHFDVELSELGLQQARELGERHADKQLDAVFVSDLQRSYRTAEIAFEGRDVPIIRDKRLRECDYGDMTRSSSEKTEADKGNRISEPFPNGESYEQCADRIRAFLAELLEKYEGRQVMVVGHRATQYGLEHWILDVPLSQAVTAPWSWQPGWTYQLKSPDK